MNDKLRAYIDSIFEEAPKTKKTVELKEEMLQNLTDKYNDLLAEGKSEDAAYNIAVASVGDVGEIIEQLNNSASRHENASSEQKRKKSAIITAISVMMYILSVVPLFSFQDERGLIGMFIIVAAATGLIIYNGMTRPKYEKIDDTVVEEFKQWKANNSATDSLFKAVSGAVWSVTVALYILISFATGAWHITWIVFLISGAVNSVIKAIFDLKKK